MALKLTKMTAEGFSVEYWRIEPTILSRFSGDTKTVSANVIVHVNAAARQADKPPVRLTPRSVEGCETATRVVLEGSEATSALATGDPRAAMYAKLKALEFFSGAVDC